MHALNLLTIWSYCVPSQPSDSSRHCHGHCHWPLSLWILRLVCAVCQLWHLSHPSGLSSIVSIIKWPIYMDVMPVRLIRQFIDRTWNILALHMPFPGLYVYCQRQNRTPSRVGRIAFIAEGRKKWRICVFGKVQSYCKHLIGFCFVLFFHTVTQPQHCRTAHTWTVWNNKLIKNEKKNCLLLLFLNIKILKIVRSDCVWCVLWWLLANCCRYRCSHCSLSLHTCACFCINKTKLFNL